MTKLMRTKLGITKVMGQLDRARGRADQLAAKKMQRLFVSALYDWHQRHARTWRVEFETVMGTAKVTVSKGAIAHTYHWFGPFRWNAYGRITVNTSRTRNGVEPDQCFVRMAPCTYALTQLLNLFADHPGMWCQWDGVRIFSERELFAEKPL